MSESDNAITVNIQKTGSIDQDFDVIIIPVPITAGKQIVIYLRDSEIYCVITTI